MKKSIIISLVSLSLLIFLPKIASSAGTTVVSLNPASQSVNVGDTIAVTLRVDDAVDMDSMVVDILFDSTKITYDHVTISSDISSLNWTAEAFECAPASADCINLMVLSDMFNYVNGGANIATIYFTANGAGTNNFTYANNFARNPSFEDITSAWTPASVTINEVVLSNIATVTSATYTVGATTITNVPFATSKATFLAALAVGEANQTWVDTAIADPVVSGNTLVVTAQDGSTTITYTVTVNANPDIASVVADKAALVDDSIKGANSALSNVTVALTNPLPSTGANGSTITWVSNNTGVVSSNGQTINRPTFASGDATVTMTATITKGVVTDTKVFTLTVIKLPASSVATVTSATYTVSTGGSPNNKTITDIPFGTSKAVFLAALTKGETNQTWNSTSIADPVLTGNTLVVTAEDGATTKTYTVTVDPDSIAPVITVFTIPATADSLTISITSFTATDAVGITGYKLTEVNNYQGLNSGWTDTAPTSYTFNNEGSKTLYAWAKDAAGNVSAGASGSVVVTVAIIPLDADGDGVDDNSLDKCLGTPAGAVVNHRGCVKPNFEKFDIKPNTAVLDDIDPIDNLSNFEIGQSAYGKIVFAQPVNLFRNNEPLDLDSNIIFTDKKIELKSANLTELNTSATLTIYNVPYATPKILRDGVECAADVCAVLTYTGNTLVFTVTGFSIYEAVNGDTTAPSKPTGLGATANSSSQIALSWTASTDDIGPIVYNIFRNSTTTAAIATTTGTTYSDTGLSASTQYTYYVSAYDLAGNISEVSAGASATTGNVVTPPSGGGGGGGGGGSADYNAPTNVLVIINTGEATTTSRTVTLTLSATDASSIYMMISNEPAFSGASWENFSTTKTWLLTGDNGVKVVYVKFKDSFENTSSAVSDSINLDYNGTVVIEPKPEVKVLEEKISEILADAFVVYSYNELVALNATTNGLYNSLLKKSPVALTESDKYAIAYYVHNGTPTTKILGAGERAGVLNSYLSAFGKLPKTEIEWQDVIKIGNGRWPSERNANAEAKAKLSFKKIYGREAKMANPNDNAAVTVMAYGLRPSQRNLNSEKAAILSFKYFMKRAPISAIDWDSVRAIAYSGATRKIAAQKPKVDAKVLGVKINDSNVLQLSKIMVDAAAVYSGDINAILSNVGAALDKTKEQQFEAKYTSGFIENEKNLSAAEISRLNWFITYGTAGTKILTAAERAGVISSYKTAFHKLPKTEAEWQDAVAIAYGRWPAERNAEIENEVKAVFKKIYLRDADMNNANDQAAVMALAYGLRTSRRDINSEKAALISFKNIFEREPISAQDWNAIMAIAYSGAKR